MGELRILVAAIENFTEKSAHAYSFWAVVPITRW